MQIHIGSLNIIERGICLRSQRILTTFTLSNLPLLLLLSAVGMLAHWLSLLDVELAEQIVVGVLLDLALFVQVVVLIVVVVEFTESPVWSTTVASFFLGRHIGLSIGASITIDARMLLTT